MKSIHKLFTETFGFASVLSFILLYVSTAGNHAAGKKLNGLYLDGGFVWKMILFIVIYGAITCYLVNHPVASNKKHEDDFTSLFFSCFFIAVSCFLGLILAYLADVVA